MRFSVVGHALTTNITERDQITKNYINIKLDLLDCSYKYKMLAEEYQIGINAAT